MQTLTLSQFYKQLADDIRLKSLLLILQQSELCVCELMEALDESSQPKVSRHLAQLRNLGILVDRKQQQWVFYSLNPELPKWMRDALQHSLESQPDYIKSEQSRLCNMGDRPDRLSICCP